MLTEFRALHDDAHVLEHGDRRLVIRSGWLVAVSRTDELARHALERLAAGPVALSTLEGLATGGADPLVDLARLHHLLDSLAFTLVRGPSTEHGPLLRVVPLAAGVRCEPSAIPATEPLTLSRFAYLRRRDGRLVLESGLVAARVELTSRAARRIAAALAEPLSPAALAEELDLPLSTVDAIVGHLAGAGMVDRLAPGSGPDAASGAAGSLGGDAAALDVATDVRQQWDFHDLLFHARSRLGRHDEEFGATFRFRDTLPHEPAVKPVRAGRRVPLRRPDLVRLLATDPPFTAVHEARRSIRGYGEQPMTLDQLGEFLYRVGRLRATYGPGDPATMPYVGGDKPYPNGGAAYELEIYLIAHRCAGLAPAAYHYDPAEHALVEVSTDRSHLAAMMDCAHRASAGSPAPDVLLTFTSRFGRLAWKYSGLAYAVTLKNTGALYQSCYLTATAMGLAPCGLGSGDAQLAADTYGLDWERESSVGDFMLGSAPAPPADPPAPPANAVGYNDPQWRSMAQSIVDRYRTGAGGG
jgi:SagB-type dehydrogenase family enzyme